MRQTAGRLTLLVTMLAPGVAMSGEPPKEITNSIGMKFKLIPAGEFMMGSSGSPEEIAKAFPGAEPGHFKSGFPQHKVRITKPFYLGVTEVTQGQYEKVMEKTPSYFSKTGRGADKVKGMNASSFPVEQVTWNDAVEFCKKLSAMEGQTYRLPTEAEWEYTCRAGATTKWCFGDDESMLSEYAWFYGATPHPVGQKKPNAWGLHDMHGNAWEWCSDWHGKDYYAMSPKDDPLGPKTGSYRVLRGGGWRGIAGYCQSSYRFWGRPSFLRVNLLGFRVARGPSASELESK